MPEILQSGNQLARVYVTDTAAVRYEPRVAFFFSQNI
jgi:hypothetical protein